MHGPQLIGLSHLLTSGISHAHYHNLTFEDSRSELRTQKLDLYK